MANSNQNTNSTFTDKVKLLDEKTYSIDPSGDIVLEVQQHDASKLFRVSRSCMSRASSHWRAMFDPDRGFQESLNRDKPVTLVDDSIAAVLILLLACHLRCQHVPKTLSFQELIDVCMVVDKYDCIAFLRPWLSMWMQPWMEFVKQVGYEGWTLIAWVTGEESIFRQAVEHLVLTCKTDDADQCLTSSGALFCPVLPPGLAESLLEARKAIITNAIQACHTHLEQYNRFGDGYACKANNHRDECDNQSAGSVVRPLQKFKMWPGKPEDLILNMRERSAADVEQDIKKIRSYVTPDPIQTRPGTWYMGVSHKSCPNAAPLHSVIERLANKATDIVISRYRDHLKIQKQKLADLDILELE